MAFERITVDSPALRGIPCIRETGIPVATVVAMVATGASSAQVVQSLTVLEEDDVTEALKYAQAAVVATGAKKLSDLAQAGGGTDVHQGERAAQTAAAIAAGLLRIAVAVVAFVFALLYPGIATSLRWSLRAMAIFVAFHFVLDLLWYWRHRHPSSTTERGPQSPSGAGAAAALIIPTAAAVVALISGLGKDIVMTTKVGIVALAATIVLGIALAGLQGGNQASKLDRVVLVVMVNVVFFAFAFGLLCIAIALVLGG